MNTVSFPTARPTQVQHARALTLKSLGEESLSELAEVLEYDNADGFDLNPAEGEILISAAGGESQSDIAVSVGPEGEIQSADVWTAPGAEGVPFEQFSYRNDTTASTAEYRFVFQGREQVVTENSANGTITANL